jgi:hypothetical protein
MLRCLRLLMRLSRAVLGVWAAGATATDPCQERAHEFMYVYNTYIVIYLAKKKMKF